MKVRELGDFIRDQRNSARLSIRKLSTLTGVSNPYLSQIERGLRRPSADILQAIAKALRISAETLYVQAGILDERSDADPVGEIRRDATISERQKQILVELYQSFREGGENGNGTTPAKRSAKANAKPANVKPAKTKPAAAKATKAPAAKPKPGKTAKAQKAKRATTAPRKRVAAAKRTAPKAAKRVTRRAPRRTRTR